LEVLTSWNGLMLAAFAEAAAALNREGGDLDRAGFYHRVAEENAEFLLYHLQSDTGRLLRTWKAAGDTGHRGGRAVYIVLQAIREEVKLMNAKLLHEINNLTQSLIRYKSVYSDPLEISRCVDFVESYARRCGAEVRRIEHENVPSLLVLPEEGRAPVLLMSHIDVVSADPGHFEPFERDGKLYGRGSLDDKYAVALSLILLREHLAKITQEGRGQESLPFGLLITSDEEMGGFRGAGRILKSLDTDFVIVLDGGSPDEIIVKQKGFVKLRLVSEGRTAHGSQPWLGENAIEQIVDDYVKLRGLFDHSGPDNWHRSVNLSVLHSGRPDQGESFNQVPDHAQAILDVRYTENDDLDALVERLRHELRSQVHIEASGPVFDGGESPYLDKLLQIAPAARLGVTHSASDARFLTEYGIPGVVWGAGGDDSAHSPEEHVNLSSVGRLYDLLDAFLRVI
jgi:succinyl-diaminopimelate desuccinylase